MTTRDPPIWTAGDSSTISSRGAQIGSFCRSTVWARRVLPPLLAGAAGLNSQLASKFHQAIIRTR